MTTTHVIFASRSWLWTESRGPRDTPMRAERLLTILHLLQAHTRLTARDLARRLDVSTRTVQRDLDALSLAGVPVYASRGRAGGWTLAPGYRTSLTGLTPAEAMTVFVGRSAQALADLGL